MTTPTLNRLAGLALASFLFCSCASTSSQRRLLPNYTAGEWAELIVCAAISPNGAAAAIGDIGEGKRAREERNQEVLSGSAETEYLEAKPLQKRLPAKQDKTAKVQPKKAPTAPAAPARKAVVKDSFGTEYLAP